MIEVELPDGTIVEFPEGTAPDVIKGVLSKRFGSAKPQSEGMAKLSEMSRNPAVQPPERSMGQSLYDNLIGDATDGVDSYGEQIGRGINDVARAGAAGISRGVTGMADLPGAITGLYGNAVAAGLERTGLVSPEFAGQVREGITATSPAGGGSMFRDAAAAATGGATEYKGKTTAGEYAGTVGEFLPGAAVFGGMSPGNLARFGVVPGLASEAAGQMTEGTDWETAARIGGGIAGAMLPGMVAKGLSKAISPYGGADPERLKLAQVLDDAGVPISAGQRVGNEALRRKEAFTAKGQELSEVQREAFTRAALKTAGTDAPRATPEVLAETAQRIGAVFDDVTRGVDLTPDADDLRALSGAVNTYKSLAPTGNQAPLVSNIFKDATKAFRGGNTVPASTVNTWRSSLSKLTTSADAATREAASAALEVVDDMLAKGLTTTGRAADIARLAEARGQWRNFLAIQKAATGAGEGTAAGLLSPPQLRSAVVQQGRSAYAQGRRGDLGELTRAGEGVMRPLPTSGTAENIRAMLPSGFWGGIGGLGGAATGNPTVAALGAIAGTMVPGLTGAVRMSGPMQAYLANQLAPNIMARPLTGVATGTLPFAPEIRNALRP